jgi:hypothetical protein
MKTVALPVVEKTTTQGITAFRSNLEHEHDLVPLEFNGAKDRFVRCILCDACYCQLCGKILKKNDDDNSNNSTLIKTIKL